MFILNSTNENLTEKVQIELTHLNILNNLFLRQKDILLKHFNIGIIDISKNQSGLLQLNHFLEDFNTTFDKINSALSTVELLKTKLEEIQNNLSSNELENLVNTYNELYTQNYSLLLETISNLTEFIEELFVIPHYEKSKETEKNLFGFESSAKNETLEKPNTELQNIKEENSIEKTILDEINNLKPTSSEKVSDTVVTEIINVLAKAPEKENEENHIPNTVTIVEENDTRKRITKLPLQDNDTLIISEKDGLVYLPFKVEDLKNEFLEKEKKYSGLIDLINNEYIYPISKYKNTVASRFKEAYSLMVSREKDSPFSGLELGIELAFNYSLHPAVITACKTVAELDSYLDALDEKDMTLFTAFKINFEILPK